MDIPRGLTSEEVAERQRAGLANAVSTRPSRSIKKIIASNIFTYFNLVFAVIALLLISAGSPIRNFTFIPIIAANSLIGIIQELRAKRVLDELTILSIPIARALRDGQLTKIPITELVKDDIIYLKAGDQISADARIITGEVSVNESLLTGEPDEITKSKNSELMSGSFVVQGECYAVLIRVGDQAYAAELTLKAKAIKTTGESAIIKSLNKYVRVAGAILIPLGVTMLTQQLIKGAPYPTAIEAMVAALLGLIPEGLFLLASATLVLSAMRLARQKVLLHDMKSIETLARADILCVDKTGTITTGKMKVADTIWLGKEDPEALAATIANLPEDSETMAALKKVKALFAKRRRSRRIAPKKVASTPVKIQGFSSRLKYSGVTFDSLGTFVIGAPELVLRDSVTTIKDRLDDISKKGLRVLVFAKYAGELTNQPLTKKATPLALIVIEDEIRPSAKRTFKYFEDQGVTVKVISGDNPTTVSAIAARAGIKNADHAADLSKSLTDPELSAIIENTTVFGRVTPADKRRIVAALQGQGHTVAMTGDGVNDVLALKDADCSIAMASGTSAAAGAAQMVLLNSDFSTMPSIIKEGRQVVNNLQRSGSLFIVKNLFSATAALLTIIFGIVYPLVPAQVSLISFWCIGFPSFFLAQIPQSRRIEGNFMFNILKAALPTALTAILLVASTVALSRLIGVPRELHGTLCSYVWATIGLLHLFRVARPFDRWSLAICLTCLVGLLMSVFLARPFFGLVAGLTPRDWSVLIPIACFAAPCMFFFQKITRFIFSKIKVPA